MKYTAAYVALIAIFGTIEMNVQGVNLQLEQLLIVPNPDTYLERDVLIPKKPCEDFNEDGKDACHSQHNCGWKIQRMIYGSTDGDYEFEVKSCEKGWP